MGSSMYGPTRRASPVFITVFLMAFATFLDFVCSFWEVERVSIANFGAEQMVVHEDLKLEVCTAFSFVGQWPPLLVYVLNITTR